MSRFIAPLVAAAALTAVSLPARADGDAKAGQRKAAQCMTCHGLDGVAKIPNAPNIGGETTFYLEKQLKAFRAGERKDEMMSVVAKPLTDQDIADLAAWYASIQFEVRMPGG